MPIDIKIPSLGDGITGGDVVNLLVKPGDTVTEGQGLVEIETGKATVEIPSPAAGVLKSLSVRAGEKKNVGDVIGTLETGAAATPAPAPAAASTPAPAPVADAPSKPAPAAVSAAADQDIVIPSLGDGVKEGDVTNLLVKAGDTVKEGQGLIEIETGKATVEIPAPAAGVITSLSVKSGQKAKAGDKIGVLSAAGSAAAAAPAPAPTQPSPTAPATAPVAAAAPAVVPAAAPTPGPVTRIALPAAPSVRKFAREIGITLADVKGTGPAGRISVDDVKAHSRALNAGGRPASSSAGGGIAPKPLPDFSKFGEVAVEKMNTIRRMTVQHMAYCWSTVPHVTQHDEADVGPLEKLRAKYNKLAEPKGVKLTVTALLLKLMADCMRQHAKFNASIDVTKDEIVFKKFVNIGVAVDTAKGLVVPVLRNVDRKSLLQVGGDLKTYADKVKAGKISPDDLAGGGMTLTNIGGLGGKHFTPIVNSPEVAILGVGRAEYKPVWDADAGAFVPKLMMPLSLSYDHRLIDGADGTRFLRALVEAIEMPMLALE